MTKRASCSGDTPLLEWLIGGLGALIFAATLIVLIIAGANGAPP